MNRTADEINELAKESLDLIHKVTTLCTSDEEINAFEQGFHMGYLKAREETEQSLAKVSQNPGKTL